MPTHPVPASAEPTVPAARLPVAPGAGRLLALLLALVVLAGAILFCRDALVQFWRQYAPIAAATGLQNRLDFSWFYYGMQVAARHLDPAHLLYDVPAQDQWMQVHGFSYDHNDMFGYPPSFAAFWAPLARLPYAVARALWSQLNLVVFGLGLAVAAYHASPRFGLARWLVLGSLGLWAPVVQNAFYWGQPDTIIMALLALGLWGIYRPHPGRWAPVLGGAAIGLAAAFKVTPAIVLAYLSLRWLLLRHADRREAAGLGALGGWGAVAVMVVWSGASLGWSLWPQYVRAVLPAVERSAWAHGPAPWNQSFRGILMLWHTNVVGLNHWADAFALLVVALLLAGVAVAPRLDVRLESAGAALLVLLGSPSLENHHFTVMMLPWILLVGYLLDQLPNWRRIWPWPVAGIVALASFAIVQPARLSHLRLPSSATQGTVTPVPTGHYQRLFLVGASSWGPVDFTLGLRYRDGVTGTVHAVWPDWWSPGQPLAPVIGGESEKAGVADHTVGLYGFAYPVRASATLTGLQWPQTLPPKTGGNPALHVVAATLETDAPLPSYVPLALPFNAHGIVTSVHQAIPAPRSLDGVGNVLADPSWRSGTVHLVIGGMSVPFRLPGSQATANVFNVPASPGRTSLTATLARDAPNFVAAALLMLAVLVAALAEGLSTRRLRDVRATDASLGP